MKKQGIQHTMRHTPWKSCEDNPSAAASWRLYRKLIVSSFMFIRWIHQLLFSLVFLPTAGEVNTKKKNVTLIMLHYSISLVTAVVAGIKWTYNNSFLLKAYLFFYVWKDKDVIDMKYLICSSTNCRIIQFNDSMIWFWSINSAQHCRCLSLFPWLMSWTSMYLYRLS